MHRRPDRRLDPLREPVPTRPRLRAASATDAVGSRAMPAAPLRGAIAAAVTPMKDGGRHVDEDGVGRLASFLAGGGIDGILTCGTTGEVATLSARVGEHLKKMGAVWD